MVNATYKDTRKHVMRMIRNVCSHIGFSLFAYEAAAVLLTMLATNAAKRVMEFFDFEGGIEFLGTSTYVWLSTLIFQFIIATAVYLFIMKMKKPVEVFETVKKRLDAKQTVIIGIVSIAIMQIGAYMSSFLSMLVENMRGVPLKSDLSSLIMESNIAVVIAMCVVAAPVLEEIIFRKCIIDRLRPFGEGFAVVCSGFIFAISHGNFLQVFYSFGMGALLGVLYIKTNNLKICIGYHMFINFIGSVVPMIFVRLGAEEALKTLTFTPLLTSYMVYMLFLFVITAAGVLIIFLTYNRIKYEKGVIDASLTEKVRSFVFNPGMILVFLTAVYKFILSF